MSTTVTSKVLKAAAKDATRGCRIYYISGTTTLDCWRGRYAVAAWTLELPAGARVTSKALAGTIGCCKNWTVAKWVWMPDPRTVKGRVKVTGWRSFAAQGLKVTYMYPRRY